MLDLIASFAGWCKFYFFTLSLVTALVVGVMAVVLVVIWWTTLRGQRWLLLLGAAFGTFALQYGIPSLTGFEGRLQVLDSPKKAIIDTLSWALFSNLNSLLFLAAALDLLCLLPGRLKRFRWQITALFTTSAVLEVAWGPDLGRYPDGALSALCIVILGYALFLNSGAPGRRAVASVNFVTVMLYAALHVVYLLIPWLSSNTKLAKSVDDQWKEHTARIFINSARPKTPPISDVLDAGIFGIAFLFKVALFLSALLVIVRCLSAFSPAVLRRVFDPVKARRTESLASQGILRAVGESIGSDLALLCVRLPGNSADEVMLVPWARDPSGLVGGSDPSVFRRPRAEESTIGRTLEDAVLRTSPDWESDPEVGVSRYWQFARGMRSFANVPLRFHGGVIGCLNVEWARRHGFGASDLHRIAQMTEFLIPGVQAERWLWALGQLRERLQHYNLDREKIANRTFLHDFAGELQDVLGALGVLVILDFGFQAQAGEYPAGEDPFPEAVSTAEECFRARFDCCEIEETAIHLEKKDIGKILLAVHEKADPMVQPSLIYDPQQRKGVAVLVKDCALDAYRVHFRRVLEGLHSDLDSTRVLTQEAWLRAVEPALIAAGLPLVRMTATDPPSEESWPAERLADENFKITLGPSLGSGTLPGDDFALFAGNDVALGGHRVLRVSLPTSNVDLYLGIERLGFGDELSAGLPWTDFLLRFAEAADLALVRLRLVALEIAALQFEVNELHVHELRSPATTISLNVGRLKNGEVNEGIIKNLDNAAGQLAALAALLAFYGSQDHQASVPLRDVLEYVDRIQGPSLKARFIIFSHDVGQFQVSIPFIVASLVIMTLVRNARDAMDSQPSTIINVSANLSDGYVECHVDDTGCGIPDEDRKRVFEPGFSTKEKGSGRGLPLARQAMRRQKGEVFLADRAADGFSTRFTVRFLRSVV